ncbi:MAG: AAA family ATPase [Gammaproteobacteria bacterium]|nr:AAA family ATPase [Gammaproteobacteria bacterium]
MPIQRVASYTPRIADQELKRKLASASTVVIEGPRGCGKTSKASQVANSAVFFDRETNARQICDLDANLVLEGETPRLFAEWQLAPNLWNHVRHASDARQHKGNFILTGSATPADDLTRHSGAGRISRLQMRTMSLFELGLSSGHVSLEDLLAGARVSASRPDAKINDVVEYICRDGWPAM